MIKITVIISVIALLLGPSLTEGAEWLYFIENKAGDKYYIDMDSLKRTSSHTVRLLQKIEPAHAPQISSLVSDIEIDCSGSRIKTLQETTYYRSGKTKTSRKDEDFRKITGTDIEESLLELVCSLKKTQ
jgi:hypothetical protein